MEALDQNSKQWSRIWKVFLMKTDFDLHISAAREFEENLRQKVKISHQGLIWPIFYLIFVIFLQICIFGPICVHTKDMLTVHFFVLNNMWKVGTGQNPDWVLLSGDELCPHEIWTRLCKMLAKAISAISPSISTHLELVSIGRQCKILTNPSQLFSKVGWKSFAFSSLTKRLGGMKLRREMFYSQVGKKAFLPTSRCFDTLQAFEDALEGALLFVCFLPFTFFKNIFQVHLKTHFSFLSFPGSLFFFSFNIFQVYLKVIFSFICIFFRCI